MTMTNGAILAAKGSSGVGNDVDLAGSWKDFWAAITSAGQIEGLFNVLAIFGMCLVAWAVVKWAWDRRRGGGGGFGGGGGNGITGALLVGVVLAAPNIILPAILSVFDLVIDAVVKIWQNEGV